MKKPYVMKYLRETTDVSPRLGAIKEAKKLSFQSKL
jgi:hypothetical protein